MDIVRPPSSGYLPSTVHGKSSLNSPAGRTRGQAFTLIELLVVVAVMVVMMKFAAPAFTAINSGQGVTKTAQDISGALEFARGYAMGNNTYVWVGFFEEDPTRAAGTSGSGRVVISMVGSIDGTQVYSSSATNPPVLNPASLTQIAKLLKCNSTHLDVLPATAMTRPAISTAAPNNYQVGDPSFSQRNGTTNATTFNYPLAGKATYTFNKIIQFSPLGDTTKIVAAPTQLMEIGLRPAHGNAPDANSKNLVAIQISGIGGHVEVYRP